MFRAIVGLGLLAAAQAYITSQTRARRQRLAGAVDVRSLENWEDEGGAAAGTDSPSSSAQISQFPPALGTGTSGPMGNYPAAGQAG